MQLMISGDTHDSPPSISSSVQLTDAFLSHDIFFDLSEAEQALLPFWAWAQPLIEQDRDRVIAYLYAQQLRMPGCLDTASLLSSVNAAFARRVLELCNRTLIFELSIARYQKYLQGDTPEARLADFIEQLISPAGRVKLKQKYPFLHTEIEKCSAQIADYLICLVERVANNHVDLSGLMSDRSTPGLLLSFSTEAGDRHCNGFSVTRLRFENGEVYFKPRSMALDVEYSHLLLVLRQNGVTPDQQAPAALDFGDYGYAAAITYREADSEETLRAYYRRFGGMVAIAHIFGSTDLHHENLIAAGAYPIIIDAETLFQPNHSASMSVQAQHNAFADSVLYSGLLPCGDKTQQQADLSALFMPHDSLFRRVPIGAGTDQLHLAVQKVATPFATNMPRLNGKLVEPHRFIGDMVAGFEETYQTLFAIKEKLTGEAGLLASFKPLSVRVVVRPSQVYAFLQNALTHPDYLAQPQKREDLIAKIRPQKAGWDILQGCWPSERRALLRGDVPYFTAKVGGTDLYDDSGELLECSYGHSGWDESQKRIRAMSLQDLTRQRRLLQQSVSCTTPIDSAATWWSLYPPVPLEQMASSISKATDFIREAEHIGDHIIAAGFVSGDRVSHYQLEPRGDGALRPHAVGADLYDGLAGIALFFGELWRQTNVERFRAQAELSLAGARYEYENLHTPPDCVGGFSGVAGWVYALARLGILLERYELIDEALGWLPWIASRVDADERLDVIGGIAGALLVLVEFDRIAPQRGALEVARACAQRLLTTAIRDAAGARWKTSSHPEHALTGFSHGAAGIGAALARYAAHSGDDVFMTLANEAFQFERANRKDGGWPDLRNKQCNEHADDGHLYAWCHGAPGIGLGRIAFPGALRDQRWKLDVEECITLSSTHAFGGSHCLCHGQLGNLELLMKFQEALPTEAYANSWRNLAERLLAEGRIGWRSGVISGADLLGLMTGLAGIGYALLRIADPQHVPSVLLLELPQEKR